MVMKEEEAAERKRIKRESYFVRVACNWISKIDTWTKVNQRWRGRRGCRLSILDPSNFLLNSRDLEAKFPSTSVAFHLPNRVHSLITREGTLVATFLHHFSFFFFFFIHFFLLLLFPATSSSISIYREALNDALSTFERNKIGWDDYRVIYSPRFRPPSCSFNFVAAFPCERTRYRIISSCFIAVVRHGCKVLGWE